METIQQLLKKQRKSRVVKCRRCGSQSRWFFKGPKICRRCKDDKKNKPHSAFSRIIKERRILSTSD